MLVLFVLRSFYFWLPFLFYILRAAYIMLELNSMGVNLVVKQIPLHIVQDILGHAYIENTRIYAQALDKERREMISRVW